VEIAQNSECLASWPARISTGWKPHGHARDRRADSRDPDLVERSSVDDGGLHEAERGVGLAHKIGHQEVEQWIIVKRSSEGHDCGSLVLWAHALDAETAHGPTLTTPTA